MFELIIETVQEVNIWLYGGFFKTENHSWHLFFFLTERQAKKAKEEVTSSQSFGQLTFVLSQDKKTWEFF